MRCNRKCLFLGSLAAAISTWYSARVPPPTRVAPAGPLDQRQDAAGFGSRASPWAVLIGGGGPAGTGPLFAAARTGQWDELFASGVLLVERSDRLVAGQFVGLRGLSNSFGTAFTHVVRTPAGERFFPKARSHAMFRALNVSREVGFDALASFLSILGAELAAAIQLSGGGLRLRTRVASANRGPDGLWEVELVDELTGRTEVQLARKLVATFGAEEFTLKDRLVGNSQVNFSRWYASRCPGTSGRCPTVWKSSEDFRSPERFTATFENAEVVVVGGAHSAFGVANLLGGMDKNITVSMIIRSTPRLFYYSAAEAAAANYSFAEDDVCPLTGRVNRFSGLRAGPRERSLDATRGRPSAGLRRISVVPDGDAAVQSALGRAAAIVTAVGHGARVPPIRIINQTVRFAYGDDGQINTLAGSVRTVSHGPVETLIMFGLGAGWGILPAWGGEPRLLGKGRADGVWIYQFDMGDVVLGQLMGEGGRSSSWKRIYSQKAVKATSATPMHHLGGYDMFTVGEWQNQVEVLCSSLPLVGRKTVFEVGSGGGAFLAALKDLFPDLQLFGMDYAAPMVKLASERLKGRFVAGDARLLSTFFPEVPAFDCVVSFGMMTYLNSLADVERVFVGMIKRARACVYVGEVSDSAKQAQAEKNRKKTHTATTQTHVVNQEAPSHLYIPKSLWLKAGGALNANVRIVDHTELGLTYPTAAYRYSVYVDVRSLDEIAADMRQRWTEQWRPRLSAAATSVAKSATSWLAPHFNLTAAGYYVPNTARRFALPQDEELRAYANSVAKFLLAMATAGIPPVITSGSLLALVRGQDLSKTGDIDFFAFHRHLDLEKILPPLAGAGLKGAMRGGPRHPGLEVTFRSGLPHAPQIDLFAATEGHDNYALSLWAGDNLTQCQLPGPAEFVPVTYYRWGLPVVFFMSATAVFDVSWVYGPHWRVPDKKWRWYESKRRANIQYCNVSARMGRRAVMQAPVPILGVWDLPLRRLRDLSRLHFETEANIRNLRTLVERTGAAGHGAH